MEEGLSCLFPSPVSPLLHIIPEVKKHWNGRLVILQRVVGFNISGQLHAISNDLLTPLNEGFLHVLAWRVFHYCPERVLHACLRYADGMVDTISTPLRVSRIFFAKGVRHISRELR